MKKKTIPEGILTQAKRFCDLTGIAESDFIKEIDAWGTCLSEKKNPKLNKRKNNERKKKPF